MREQTVQLHRRKNPAFAAEFEEALEQGYVTLEAEALRQRLAAQRKLRAAIDGAKRGNAALLPDDVGDEFERVMKLLARWDRKRQRPSRLSPEGGGRACTFDTAIELLDARLKALGIEIEPLSPEDAERYDGPAEREGGGGEAL